MVSFGIATLSFSSPCVFGLQRMRTTWVRNELNGHQGILISAMLDHQQALRLDPAADLPAEGLSRLQRKGVKVQKP